MTKTAEIARGTLVRFTDGPLGCTMTPYGSRVAGPIVRAGARGTYVQPHRDLLAEDWHILAVNLGGLDAYVPVHRSQFELAV